MTNEKPLDRSPELMSVGDTALLVVDMQERLLPAIENSERIIWNIRRLLDGAKVLGVPTYGTEQYPAGLGPTTPVLAQRLGPLPSKLAFSCGECGQIFNELAENGISKILVVGIETHVCVAQTVFDLMGEGFRIYLAVDAVGSRMQLDRETALGRIDSAGATLTTTEASLFEWCAVAGTPEFKQISALVREECPSGS